MRTIDLLAIHWTGGVGMFTALAGHPVVELGVIEIVEATLEPLNRLVLDLDYGHSEMILEGFPGMEPAEFVRRFYDSHRCTRQSELIRRIRFRYVDLPR